MEAGYFNDDERCIPECPVKQTIFGPSRVASSDNMFGKLLNSYIKELPGLPASIVKSSLMQKFFELRASDIGLPEQRYVGLLNMYSCFNHNCIHCSTSA